MPQKRITPEKREAIRKLYASGTFTHIQLGEKFGLPQGIVSAIVNAMPPRRSPHVEVKRAKAIIKDGVELWLQACLKCGKDYYGLTSDSKCEDCRRKKKAPRRLAADSRPPRQVLMAVTPNAEGDSV